MADKSMKVTYGVYVVEADEKGSISVTKEGMACDNAKGALREIAQLAGFEVNPDWTSRQFGSKLMKYLSETNPAVPTTSPVAPQPQQSAAVPQESESKSASEPTKDDATPISAGMNYREMPLEELYQLCKKGDVDALAWLTVRAYSKELEELVAKDKTADVFMKELKEHGLENAEKKRIFYNCMFVVPSFRPEDILEEIYLSSEAVSFLSKERLEELCRKLIKQYEAGDCDDRKLGDHIFKLLHLMVPAKGSSYAAYQIARFVNHYNSKTWPTRTSISYPYNEEWTKHIGRFKTFEECGKVYFLGLASVISHFEKKDEIHELAENRLTDHFNFKDKEYEERAQKITKLEETIRQLKEENAELKSNLKKAEERLSTAKSRSDSSKSSSSNSSRSSDSDKVEVRISYIVRARGTSMTFNLSETVKMPMAEYKSLLNGSMKNRIAYTYSALRINSLFKEVTSATVSLV